MVVCDAAVVPSWPRVTVKVVPLVTPVICRISLSILTYRPRSPEVPATVMLVAFASVIAAVRVVKTRTEPASIAGLPGSRAMVLVEPP